MKKHITILYDQKNEISVKFTLFPILVSKYYKNFKFLNYETFLMRKDSNHALIILGKLFTKLSEIERWQLLENASSNYKKIIFFDDLDGAEIQFLPYFKYFTLYFKKQLYKDHSLYNRNDLIGNKLFTDYYAKTFGEFPEQNKQSHIQNQNINFDPSKLRLGWNIGVGAYNNIHGRIYRNAYSLFGIRGTRFLHSLTKIKKPCYTDKSLICLARFSANPKRKHIDFQRKLFLEKCSSNPDILTGPTTFKTYKKELKIAAATLSPFGFGEICFRDFEAILSGSVLLKPDMSHIQTWPNVYIPNETYIPLKWDGSDILSETEALFENSDKLKMFTENSFKVLADSYKSIDSKIKDLIESLY